jgi:hypothetical protein
LSLHVYIRFSFHRFRVFDKDTRDGSPKVDNGLTPVQIQQDIMREPSWGDSGHACEHMIDFWVERVQRTMAI